MKKSLLFLMLSLCAVGCKQARGQRCQVDDDCADGLICSKSEPKTCGGGTGDSADAEPAKDAAIDAPVDSR